MFFYGLFLGVMFGGPPKNVGKIFFGFLKAKIKKLKKKRNYFKPLRLKVFPPI